MIDFQFELVDVKRNRDYWVAIENLKSKSSNLSRLDFALTHLITHLMHSGET